MLALRGDRMAFPASLDCSSGHHRVGKSRDHAIRLHQLSNIDANEQSVSDVKG